MWLHSRSIDIFISFKMKIQIWSIGKNHEPYVKNGVEDFSKRLSKYYPLQWNIISPPKNAGLLSETELKKKEAEIIMNALAKDDFLVALDGNGKQMNSEQLASFIQSRANESVRQLIFLIGGAYGLDEKILKRSNYQWSLSALTFPHQLVRLVISEQLYRACTILRNERYHHG